MLKHSSALSNTSKIALLNFIFEGLATGKGNMMNKKVVGVNDCMSLLDCRYSARVGVKFLKIK